jgi:O-antigen ligase
VNIQSIKNLIVSKEQSIYVLSFVLMVLGLFRLNVLITIGLVVACVTAVFMHFESKRKVKLPMFGLVLLILYLWMGISFFWTENTNFFLERMQVKLPLILSVLMIGVLNFESSNIKKLFNIILGIFLLSAIPSVFIYFTNMDLCNRFILMGRAIHTPFVSHIRYSLMLVVCFQIALYYAYSERSKIYSFVAFLFFGFIHILSVRSAMVTLYASLFVFVFYFIVTSDYSKWIKFGVFIGMFLLAFGATYIPSIQNKIAYMRYDLTNYSQGNLRDHSDGERIQSIMNGVEIIKHNPMLGVGEGDLRDEIYKLSLAMKENSQITVSKMPHNQFIWTFASTGIIGVVFLFLFLILYIGRGFAELNMLMMMFGVTLFLSMLFEQTLESQVGVMFAAIPLVLFSKIKTIWEA